MALLYLVDRLITTVVQKLSQYVSVKYGINRHFQMLILALSASVISTAWRIMTASSSDELGFLGIVVIITFMVTSWIIHNPVSNFLKVLHRFFDIDGATNPDKLYEDGYRAWAHIIIAVMLFGVYSYLPYRSVAIQAHLPACFMLVDSYLSFASRKKGNNQKRRNTVTEEMAKLLEKCSGWLPKPQRLPSS